MSFSVIYSITLNLSINYVFEKNSYTSSLFPNETQDLRSNIIQPTNQYLQKQSEFGIV